MSLVSTTAFILRLDPLSEKDVAVALLTRGQGVVRAAVRGARGKGRKGAALQLLTEASVTLFRKEGAELARVESLEIMKSAYPLAERAETAMLLPYLSESVLTFVPESEASEEIYRLTRHVLDALEAGGDPSTAARYFEVWLLRFGGLLPDDRTCAVCGAPLGTGDVRLDPDIPGFVMPECARPSSLRVPAPSRALLRAMLRAPLPEVPRGEPAALADVEQLTREVRRRFLGHELKSYRFLRSLA